MQWFSTSDSLLAVLGLSALATMAGDSAQAVTKLHDPALNHITTVHGATNGSGAHRGPWLAQIAIAKGEKLEVNVSLVDGTDKVAPILRVIAGDGTIIRGGGNAEFRTAGVCFVAPVTGWVTVHIDIPGIAERRFKVDLNRNTGCE